MALFTTNGCLLSTAVTGPCEWRVPGRPSLQIHDMLPHAVLRLLGIALCRTFHPDDASASALLERPTRWAVDDQMLQLVTGLLGVAIGTSAAASAGGGGSPRAALTPRAGLTPRAAAAQTPRAPAAQTPRVPAAQTPRAQF